MGNHQKHSILRAYEDYFDFPVYEEPPLCTYMLAATPRSGSTYFALKLWETGILGAPLEYGNFPLAENLISRLRFGNNLPRYWKGVQKIRTSPNGVFGFKMFMTNYLELLKSDGEMIKCLTPDCVIYLTRDDVTSQAISYSRALQTSVWFAGFDEHIEPKYNAKHIQECVQGILAQGAFWERYFDVTKPRILRITYERFLFSPKTALKEIADFVGAAEQRMTDIRIPSLERQTDEINREWRVRYLHSQQ